MTREEHADYVRWLKSLPRRKDHFRMPCPECSATRSNPKDPSFSVHITREGGWAKCFHCDFSFIIQTSDRMIRSGYRRPREIYTDTEAHAGLLCGTAPEQEPAAHQ